MNNPTWVVEHGGYLSSNSHHAGLSGGPRSIEPTQAQAERKTSQVYAADQKYELELAVPERVHEAMLVSCRQVLKYSVDGNA